METPESQMTQMEASTLTTTKTQKLPWTVDVDVYLNPPGTVPPFHLKTSLPTNAEGDIIFRNNRRPGFMINFNLYDELNPGYTFPPANKIDDALWSHGQAGCPPENSGQWDEFETVRVKPGLMTLVVKNKNESACTFGYTLRVTKNNGASYLDLDPGGTNENGPRT